MSILGIIPIGGNASRMSGIPKFLLPSPSGNTLLDNTISHFHKNNIFNIASGVSEINNLILKNNKDIQRLVVDTKTMSDTVVQILSNFGSPQIKKNILIMPDTYINIENQLGKMVKLLDKYKIAVLLWNIQDYQIGKVGQCNILDNEVVDTIDKDPTCNYKHLWGVIGWTSDMNTLIDPSWSTIGELLRKANELNIKIGSIVVDDLYYDCGTYFEYFNMIKKLG